MAEEQLPSEWYSTRSDDYCVRQDKEKTGEKRKIWQE